MARITIEFYKPIVHPDGEIAFPEVLDRISALHPPERIRQGNEPAGIFGLGHAENEYWGAAARIRMDDFPRIADIVTGEIHEINVRDPEGLSEEAHFLYDRDMNIIAIQKRLHMRASAIRELISGLAQVPVTFDLMLRRDAWERFQRMPLVKKIFFKLARPQDVAGQPQPAVRRVFQEIAEFDGVSAKIEISIERVRNRGLNLDSVRELVASYREHGDDFDALSITGAIQEQEVERLETIDFIGGRLQHVEDVEQRGRLLDPEGCRLALRRGIRANRDFFRRFRA